MKRLKLSAFLFVIYSFVAIEFYYRDGHLAWYACLVATTLAAAFALDSVNQVKLLLTRRTK